MTQKELLYFEDAIGHEKNIMEICEESIKNVEDEVIKTFLENELNTHKTTKEKLITMLEEQANE